MDARAGRSRPHRKNQERLATLATYALKLNEAKGKREELEKKHANYVACFCQEELLKLIKQKRYARTPRKIANALAGLPIMSCRQSALRCSRHQYTWEPALTYQVFEFLESTWKLRDPEPAISRLELFERAIRQLLRFKLVKTDQENQKVRRENNLRTHLGENWFYVRKAIQDSVQLASHPGEVPFLIHSKFREYLAKPRSASDILLAEEARLTLWDGVFITRRIIWYKVTHPLFLSPEIPPCQHL